MISVLDSAYRHRVKHRDIIAAWSSPVAEFIERDDPMKVIRIGFDTHARLLEIGGEIYAQGEEKIFHAMRARKRYIERIMLR